MLQRRQVFPHGRKLLREVHVPERGDHRQPLRSRLGQDIVQLFPSEAGVDGQQNDTDFRRSELKQHPLGDVVGPNGKPIPFAEAHLVEI